MGNLGIGYVFKSIASLLLIIAAIYFVLKKLQEVSQKGNQHMRIVERLPLGRTSSLCIAEIYGKYYLISCTEQHNEIIREFEPSEIKADWKKTETREKENKDTDRWETIWASLKEKGNATWRKQNG